MKFGNRNAKGRGRLLFRLKISPLSAQTLTPPRLRLRNRTRKERESKISFSVADLKDFSPSTEKGTLICNPPYGERLLDFEQCKKIYSLMGRVFEQKHGWSYGIISPDEEFETSFGRKADKRRKLYNGMIKCQFYMYFK